MEPTWRTLYSPLDVYTQQYGSSGACLLGLLEAGGQSFYVPRLLKLHRNATQDIYQRIHRRCFVGLTNNLSAGALTDANCGQKHLTLFPLESVLRHNYRVLQAFY